MTLELKELFDLIHPGGLSDGKYRPYKPQYAVENDVTQGRLQDLCMELEKMGYVKREFENDFHVCWVKNVPDETTGSAEVPRSGRDAVPELADEGSLGTPEPESGSDGPDADSAGA